MVLRLLRRLYRLCAHQRAELHQPERDDHADDRRQPHLRQLHRLCADGRESAAHLSGRGRGREPQQHRQCCEKRACNRHPARDDERQRRLALHSDGLYHRLDPSGRSGAARRGRLDRLARHERRFHRVCKYVRRFAEHARFHRRQRHCAAAARHAGDRHLADERLVLHQRQRPQRLCFLALSFQHERFFRLGRQHGRHGRAQQFARQHACVHQQRAVSAFRAEQQFELHHQHPQRREPDHSHLRLQLVPRRLRRPERLYPDQLHALRLAGRRHGFRHDGRDRYRYRERQLHRLRHAGQRPAAYLR